MAKWPKDFEQKVLPWLQKFQAISVREESNVPYLTSLGLSNVVCVCDPTILHKGDFYRRKFSIVQALHTMPLQPFVFVYKIRETLPNAVQETLTNTKTITVDLQKKKTMVSVSDWLANIDHAEWIITDSFHCAVFCILFHKQFVVIPNRSTGVGMNERFATILGKTGLEYRMLQGNEFKEKFQEKLNRPVDWNKIDSILEDWRTYSGNWLKNALE
ncbi:hypothetical protein AGMMS49938_04460 [Fibrobacterales bacterium]|nr:hypothetical protein AGMMS49938_04460 [Fibrobacterales bacterium]